MSTQGIPSFLCSLAVIFFLRWLVKLRTRLPLPPGPKGLPIIGNYYLVPKEHEWLTYARWSQEFGSDLIHLSSFGTHFIIVNSAKAVEELFEKRSAQYSDRPPLNAMRKILHINWLLALLPYGERWRSMRRAFHTYFQPSATPTFHPLLLKAAHTVLRNLLEQPEDYHQHLRHMANYITLSIGYGLDVKPRNDPYVHIAEKAMEGLCMGSSSEASLFDAVPFLTKTPSWFFGGQWKQDAEPFARAVDDMVEEPYKAVQRSVANNAAKPSVTLSIMNEEGDSAFAKQIPANIYMAGADTTVSALAFFMLAMTKYPDAQRAAQQEIDRVVGNDRLPDFSDEGPLPYLDALLKETLRWQTVTPLAIQHRVMADDVYNNYFIPGGSIVIPNAWAVLHDPETYPNPFYFSPERWLQPSSVSTGTPSSTDNFPEIAFGCGRRTCPGRFIARSSMWITMASILAAFDIVKDVDEQGREIDSGEDMTTGMVV
ncbi:CyP450 monooxygenase [Amylostereum chailletii]|nr:CyP450 monooxygenase [Amylostereum chailletii]